MTDYDEADLREKNIKVFVRILPLERCCESCARIDNDHKKIFVRCLQEMQPNRIVTSKKPTYWCFQTDGIFYDSSQEDVYHTVTKGLLLKFEQLCLYNQQKTVFKAHKSSDGANCILIGYGQTGSGKSFTITGLRNNWEHRGLVARLLSDMFAERSTRKKVNRIQYGVSFVELHGKETRDLLLPDTENRIAINDRDPFKEVSMANVDNEEEALRKIFEGESRRSIVKGSTYLASHLATAVITIHVSNVSLNASRDVTKAKMHIVEMAGIGTVRRSDCWTPMDIGRANLTKIELEQFFSYLSGTRPYSGGIRSSNLLKILGSVSLISSAIRFICHVRIAKEDLDITLSALKFTANIAKLRPVKVKKDVNRRSDLIVQRLQDEMNSLKKELMINDIFLHQEALMNVSKSRMEQINRSVLNFLNGKISDFTLFSVSQAQVLLKCIKDLYNRLTAKEIEVEKLQETYENFVRNITQTNESTTWLKETELRTESQSNNRKRTRSSSRPLTEIQEIPKETEREEVGSLAKNTVGVTLGPYTENEEEEEANEEEADGDEIPKINKHLTGSEQNEVDSQKMLRVRQMFECFLKKEKIYARMKERLDKSQRTLDIVRQRFANLIDNYFQVKRNLDNARNNLNKHQQMRYAMEVEGRVNEGNKITPIVETIVDRDIACYQKMLMNLEEEVAQTQNEIRELSEQQLEIRSKLKLGFLAYCKEKDSLSLYNDKAIKTLLQSNVEAYSAIMRHRFNQFQRVMMRNLRVKERMKKVRLDRERTCKNADP